MSTDTPNIDPGSAADLTKASVAAEKSVDTAADQSAADYPADKNPADTATQSSDAADTAKAAKTIAHPRQDVGETRLWHRRPGQKIDDLLLKRHLRYAPLTRLINQSDQRKSLSEAVRALLPDTIAPSVTVLNYRPPALVLRVGNASLATRLRYLLPELTTKLRNLADFNDLTKISLRVVQSHTPAPPERAPRYLPAAAVNSLTEFAETLGERSDYRQLRDTILRLSEHTAGDVDPEK